MQWASNISGFAFLTATLISLVIFLAFIKKNWEELSQRILNVLYTKLAIFDIILSINLYWGMVWNQSSPTLGPWTIVYMQFRGYLGLLRIVICLEISLCTLLRLFSSQLYIWASLHTPHTAYTIIQAFTIVATQYLLNLGSELESASSVEEYTNMMRDAGVIVVVPLVLAVLILQMIITLRSLY